MIKPIFRIPEAKRYEAGFYPISWAYRFAFNL